MKHIVYGVTSTSTGASLDVVVQSHRDARAAKRLMHKLLEQQGCALRVIINDKMRS